MDRTLNPGKRSNKRRKARNWKAWQIMSPDGVRCRCNRVLRRELEPVPTVNMT